MARFARTPGRFRTRVALAVALTALAAPAAHAETAARLREKANESLRQLMASNDAARALASEAKAALVFPTIVKGGFLFGGQFGDGALIERESTTGYYRSVAASYGLQAGIQTFGYALFFMNDKALDYFRKTHGWEIGVGPTVTVLDHGMAGAITSTTARSDVYAIFFDQKGLMAGIGVQGTKITQIHPK
jgi:lipid-binding SYLF domain-containing protein